MYYLFGKTSVLKTVMLLAKTVSTRAVSNLEDLRFAYLEFLRQNSPEGIVPNDEESIYCYKKDRIDRLVKCFADDSDLTDIQSKMLDNTPVESMHSALERVELSKDLITQVNPELGEIFKLVIHTIFYTRSLDSGGGSVSEAKGVIWSCNRKAWTTEDISEFLVHEFTHNLLFLDEIRFKHYTDFKAIMDPNNFALSAILNRARPLDKVFHSLIVAHEVIQYRLELGEPVNPIVHPSTSIMISSCKNTINSLYNLFEKRPNPLVTTRFMEILNRVDNSMNKLSLSAENRVLN